MACGVAARGRRGARSTTAARGAQYPRGGPRMYGDGGASGLLRAAMPLSAHARRPRASSRPASLRAVIGTCLGSTGPNPAARAHGQTARRRGACDAVASAWGMAVCGTSSGGRRSRPCAWISAPRSPRATSCGTAAAAAFSPQLRPTLSSDTTADTSLPPLMPPVAAYRGSVPPRGRRQMRGDGVQAPLHILRASAWPAAAEGRGRTGSAPHPSGSRRPCFSPPLSSSAVHGKWRSPPKLQFVPPFPLVRIPLLAWLLLQSLFSPLFSSTGTPIRLAHRGFICRAAEY
ncbi:hypothetical protein C2845_PM15G02800 [Panicum miliaceum]|uniref:Uncharacterized protein n=1 Tax=Panicum miliaceum TaxID=4540 RepID=A0A3L6Q579_PANMI|nr:hypothetical protein C2845_PM15G02800 [Panicum miliaceum]